METPIIIYLDLFAISIYHIHIRSRRIYDTAGPDLNTLEIKRNIPNWSNGTKIYNNFIVISKKDVDTVSFIEKENSDVRYLLAHSVVILSKNLTPPQQQQNTSPCNIAMDGYGRVNARVHGYIGP